LGGDLLKIGASVVFNRKNYKVYWLYASGYCEIREEGSSHKVELVPLSKIEIIELGQGKVKALKQNVASLQTTLQDVS
jgi:hypothetical protein